MKDQVIRFGVGTADEPYVPVWRIWPQRSDVYVAARDIAGLLKISLHETGEWVTQFTAQSGAKFGRTRRAMTWKRPTSFARGWVQGPTVVVPAVDWAGELPPQQKVNEPDKVNWFRAPKRGEKVSFMILFAHDRSADVAAVSRPGDLYVREPLYLKNGEVVWLQIRYEALGSGEPEYLDRLEREFRAFSTTLQPTEMTAAGIDVFKDQLLVIQIPLGRRHFTLSQRAATG